METTVLPNGITIETDTNHERLWQRMIEHYSQRSNLWECPWCGGSIDAICDERDGDMFEDTWGCVGLCNLLITFITPTEYKEYHEVPDGLWKVLVESAISIDWYAPEEADDEVSDNAAEARSDANG